MGTEWYGPLRDLHIRIRYMKKKRDRVGSDGTDTEQEIRQAIGARIGELRRTRKLSAKLVGERLGLSREAITHIETGRNNVTAIAVWKLATLFRCDVKEFFPDVPDGYGLTRLDTDKIAQEGGVKAARWAEALFGTKKKHEP